MKYVFIFRISDQRFAYTAQKMSLYGGNFTVEIIVEFTRVNFMPESDVDAAALKTSNRRVYTVNVNVRRECESVDCKIDCFLTNYRTGGIVKRKSEMILKSSIAM